MSDMMIGKPTPPPDPPKPEPVVPTREELDAKHPYIGGRK